MSSGKTYSFSGLRAEPCTYRKPFSRRLRGSSPRKSQRLALSAGLPLGLSNWSRVQKMARSAPVLKPSGSNRAPWSWLPSRQTSQRHHQVDALARIGPVADDVAQAIDLGDALLPDIRQHGLERFEVAVDVAD